MRSHPGRNSQKAFYRGTPRQPDGGPCIGHHAEFCSAPVCGLGAFSILHRNPDHDSGSQPFPLLSGAFHDPPLALPPVIPSCLDSSWGCWVAFSFALGGMFWLQNGEKWGIVDCSSLGASGPGTERPDGRDCVHEQRFYGLVWGGRKREKLRINESVIGAAMFLHCIWEEGRSIQWGSLAPTGFAAHDWPVHPDPAACAAESRQSGMKETGSPLALLK